jgi:AcrR family transcriptional regulator
MVRLAYQSKVEAEPMARRSTHTHDELRELVLQCAQAIIEENGLGRLSAREIARRVGYSPGTLYNLFESIPDLILHIEARVLADLRNALAGAMDEAPPERAVRSLVDTYFAFTRARPRLWSVLFEHHVSRNTVLPAWYMETVEGLLEEVERALRPAMPEADPAALRRSARLLWTILHGITMLATAHKLSGVLTEPVQLMVDEFLTIYLRGLRQAADGADRE